MWRIVWTVVAVAATLAAVVALIAHYWPPGSLYALTIAAFSPYLALGGVLGIVLFAVLRGRTGWAGLALAVVVVAWQVAVQAPLYVSATPPAGGRPVTVMTANLKLGTADTRDVVDAVRAHGVDLLMLQELTTPERARLAASGLDDALPYHVTDARGYGLGTGLWSRYPLQHKDISRVLGFSLVQARVALPGRTTAVPVVVLHVYGPHPATQFPRWHDDLRLLPAILHTLPPQGPALVGGDFNATWDVRQFRTLLGSGFADAADQAGAGITPTFPADRSVGPFIAIDHVLTRDAVATALDTLSVSGSDHRAVLTTVVLPAVGPTAGPR